MPRRRLVERLVVERLIAEDVKVPNLRAISNNQFGRGSDGGHGESSMHVQLGLPTLFYRTKSDYATLTVSSHINHPGKSMGYPLFPKVRRPMERQEPNSRLNRKMTPGPAPTGVAAVKPSVKHAREDRLAINAVGAQHRATSGCPQASPPNIKLPRLNTRCNPRGAGCLGSVVS